VAGHGGKTHVNCQVRICAVRRINVQFEQLVNIKFCVKLGKTATETSRVFEWHRRFVLGRVSVEDDTISGQPSSSQNKDNVVRIKDMIQEDCTVTVRMLADALNINKSTCHQILQEDLGKQKLNARLVLHALTQHQKEVRASICYMRHRTIPHSPTVLWRGA
jgi:ribosomal protein S25